MHKKYHDITQSTLNFTINNQLKEQLRNTIQQYQQTKLSFELEMQKRIVLEQQIANLKEKNGQLVHQCEKIRSQHHKIGKKYQKLKQKTKSCVSCKQQQQYMTSFQRQRSIYLKERQLLQNQIKQLNYKVQNFWNHSEFQTLHNQIESYRNQLEAAYDQITVLQRTVNQLNDKIGGFQKYNEEILNNVQILEQKIDELQLQNTLLKGFSKKEQHPTPKRQIFKKKFEQSIINTSLDKQLMFN